MQPKDVDVSQTLVRRNVTRRDNAASINCAKMAEPIELPFGMVNGE